MKANEQLPAWERQLRQGLDAIADMSQEEPPNLADLQMLVADVQAEQRRQLGADLLKFWGVAAVMLSLALSASAHWPAYFLAWQAATALLLLVGALAWRSGRKRVVE